MRSTRQQGVLGLLGEVGQQVKQGGQLSEEDRVCPTHQQKLSGLRDVLRRCTPVHVAAGVTVAHPVQLPDQRHQGVPGARQALLHGVHVEVRKFRLAGYLRGCLRRDDVEFRLRLRQGGFDVQPSLVARRLREQAPNAGVLDT